MKVLALALDDKVLALAPQVLALVLALREKSWSCQGQDFSRPATVGRSATSCHVLLYVYICCAHTHVVTRQSARS